MAYIIILPVILAVSSISAQTGKLGGRITDAETGRPMSGVAVLIVGTGIGTYTGKNGTYLIKDIPAGNYRIEVSMISFGTQNREVKIDDDKTVRLDFELRQRAIGVEGVVVTPGHYGITRGTGDPDQFLTVDEIKTTTGAWGDVYMSLSSLPGVVSHGPAAPIYVQGGRSEENLVLFDQGWVANPFHMDIGGGGVYSIFTPPLLSGVNLYTAGFGAEYGDCLSAVLDVDTRDGDYYDYEGSASLSLSNAELFVEGPVPGTNNRSSFMLSGRRSYFDLLIGLSDYDDDFEVFPNYYDFTAKVSTRLSVKHRIALTGLWAADNAVLKPTSLDSAGGITGSTEWDSKKGVVSAGWYASASEYLTSRMVLSASLSDIEYNLGEVWHNDETKTVFALREDVTWNRPENHTIKTGFAADSRIHEVRANMPVLSHPLENLRIDMPTVEADTSMAGHILGAYLTDIWRITERLSLAPGVRTDYFTTTEEFTVSPRIAAAFSITDRVVLRGAWGLYHQTPSLMELAEASGNPDLPSRRAQHMVCGIETELPAGFSARLEGFYKSFRNLPLTDSTGSLTDDGEGYAWGGGLLLQAPTSGRLNGWGSYAYTVAERKEYGYSELVPPDFDMRHIATLVANYEIGSGWGLGTKFHFASGLPFSPIEDAHQDSLTGYWIPIPGEINSERMPAYHALDIQLLKRWVFENWNIAAFIEIMNLYHHVNVADVYYVEDYSEYEYMPFFGILPSFGVIANF